MKAAVISEKGRRPEMEDTYFLDLNFGGKGWVYVGVYDGHGGRFAAEYASRKLHTTFLTVVRRGATPQEAFISSYETVSDAVAGQSSGTTAVDVFIDDGVIYSANAGDARAIVVGHNSVHQLTVDHRLSDPSERQRIQSMGGIVDYPYIRRGPFGVMPTRTIGDSYFKPVGVIATPSVGQYEISSTDLILVAACDGLWDVMDNDAVADFAMSSSDPRELVKRLKEEVLVHRLGTDNLTMGAISLRGPSADRERRRSPVARGTHRPKGRIDALAASFAADRLLERSDCITACPC